MHYARILEAFYAEPWAILAEKWQAIRAFLHLKAKGEDVPQEQVDAIVAERDSRRDLAIPAALVTTRRPDGVLMSGRVAIVPVFGVLAQRAGALDQMSGVVSAERIGATLDGLVADRQVKAIVLAYDSPGGSVFGIEELGRKILAAREEKRIVAIADSVAASAAYWLASQANEVAVTPGGQVGSIGVIAAHMDFSKWEEMQGIRTTLVTSSPHKAELAPETPLSEEARAELQGKVDHYHGLFVGAVARGRGVSAAKVEKDFGGGRMLTAKQAVERGAADRVNTLTQLLGRLGAGDGDGPKAEGPGIAIKLAAYRAQAQAVQALQ